MIAENEIIDGCNILFNGRLFSVKWKQVNKVIIRPVDDIGFIEAPFDAIEPIPIRPEILEKIGFAKNDENSFSWQDHEQKTYKVELRNHKEIVLIPHQEKSEIKVKSLHQLQKLLFDLSNQCLTIIENTAE